MSDLTCPHCGAPLPAHSMLVLDASVTYTIEAEEDGWTASFQPASVTTYDDDRVWYCIECSEPIEDDEILDELERVVRFR